MNNGFLSSVFLILIFKYIVHNGTISKTKGHNIKMFKTVIYLILLPIFLTISLSTIYTLYHYTSEAETVSDYGVVFGAKVWQGGTPSHSLYDRTATSIRLFKEGKVRNLIFSGGFSDTGYWETDVMKKIALESGVPENRIVIDREGINTIATLKNIEVNGSFTLISNDFHLGRIRLLAYKVGLKDIQLQKAKYHYGRYIKEVYFFGREVIANIYYLFKA